MREHVTCVPLILSLKCYTTVFYARRFGITVRLWFAFTRACVTRFSVQRYKYLDQKLHRHPRFRDSEVTANRSRVQTRVRCLFFISFARLPRWRNSIFASWIYRQQNLNDFENRNLYAHTQNYFLRL